MASIARIFRIRNNVLKIKSYTITTSEVLGQGGFGIVFKGFDTKKNPIAANRVDGSQHADILTHKYDKILQLDHHNIIRILDMEKVGNLFWIIMEFCEVGDLNKFYS